MRHDITYNPTSGTSTAILAKLFSSFRGHFCSISLLSALYGCFLPKPLLVTLWSQQGWISLYIMSLILNQKEFPFTRIFNFHNKHICTDNALLLWDDSRWSLNYSSTFQVPAILALRFQSFICCFSKFLLTAKHKLRISNLNFFASHRS